MRRRKEFPVFTPKASHFVSGLQPLSLTADARASRHMPVGQRHQSASASRGEDGADFGAREIA
jgi:hypothetical protein